MMSTSDIERLLQAIAISSGANGIIVAHQQRLEAFQSLEQFKSYPGRVTSCIELIGRRSILSVIGSDNVDVTVSAKLYALGIIEEFLKIGYSGLNESDRGQLRTSILLAARQLSVPSAGALPGDGSRRILAIKVASLLSELALREFPQRWQSFVSDMLSPVSNGGLWCEKGADAGDATIGAKICLECMKLITEDCTDSDFNSKISTTRRNDILLGMNEMSSQILPPIFELLSKQFGDVVSSKATLQQMNQYLASNGRTVAQMTQDEQVQYQHQLDRREAAGSLVVDILGTIEKFCGSMPLDWMFKVEDGKDFVAALLHLLQENVANIQVLAVACLQQLSMRKLDENQFFRLVSSLPPALFEASNAAALRASERGVDPNSIDMLVEQLKFHRSLSKMGSTLVTAHLAHITADKNIASGKGPKFDAVSNYLRLLSEMMSHQSGVICGEQINTWVGLLRDPAIVRTKVLSPHLGRVLTAYMNHIVKVNWDDIYEQEHPYTALIEGSWDDNDDYNEWLGNMRSKASQLFRAIANMEPEISVTIVHSKLRTMLNAHYNGEPRDRLNLANNELTVKSTACIQIEGATQPLDNILSGMPSWVIDNGSYDEKRMKIRSIVQPLLSELAKMIVSWTPSDLWLKFRRTTLLEALKHYWKYEPSTLPQGVDSILTYLSTKDNPPREELSDDVISLRKKCGVSLVAVSKEVPHLLVPWLAQLSDSAKTLLSSGDLSPTNEMHLYEFLSCVATAVENPVDRSNFVADVVSNSIQKIASQSIQRSIQSPENFLAFLGIAQAGTDPSCVANPEFVRKVTADFSSLFSSLNQLLSVGKRCHEAARKRANGGLPVERLTDIDESAAQNFPDEGPVSISDLAMNDPFVPLWPKILPTLLQVLDVAFQVWHPECQAVLLRNSTQRYVLAISDDEAFLATKQDSTVKGVFGKGGTAGSIVSGIDRRDLNLKPRWSGWFNELRNTCFQLLGLLCVQRVLYAPEMSSLYPRFAAVMTNPNHLQSLEHRHLTQYLKQFIEMMMMSCPATMYQTHLTAILGPVFEHLQLRFQYTWGPIIATGQVEQSRPITSDNCAQVADQLAGIGAKSWLKAYYQRSGLFVGDLDSVTAEAASEKARVELTRTFADMMQTTLALKGVWALVLANKAKEEASKKNVAKSTRGPKSRVVNDNKGPSNADGTKRTGRRRAFFLWTTIIRTDIHFSVAQRHIDARFLNRIDKLCHFLLLENEQIAGYLVLTVIQCLEYPDAYTCRRCTRVVHRILEAVAWVERYTEILGSRLFSVAIKTIVTEPKWAVGTEWDVINVIRDIYDRLVLGQYLLPGRFRFDVSHCDLVYNFLTTKLSGGQGPGLQQNKDPSNPTRFEQTKVVNNPLQGGGISVAPSDAPRRVLFEIGMSEQAIIELEQKLTTKRSAKDQKDALKDVLRVVAERIKHSVGSSLERASENEGLLHNTKSGVIEALPEKLVTHSMVKKREGALSSQPDKNEIAASHLFG